MLFSINKKTGKTLWEQIFYPQGNHRPILTKQNIYVDSKKEPHLQVFDTLSGTEIPIYFQEKNKETRTLKQFIIYKNKIIRLFNNKEYLEITCEE